MRGTPSPPAHTTTTGATRRTEFDVQTSLAVALSPTHYDGDSRSRPLSCLSNLALPAILHSPYRCASRVPTHLRVYNDSHALLTDILSRPTRRIRNLGFFLDLAVGLSASAPACHHSDTRQSSSANFSLRRHLLSTTLSHSSLVINSLLSSYITSTLVVFATRRLDKSQALTNLLATPWSSSYSRPGCWPKVSGELRLSVPAPATPPLPTNARPVSVWVSTLHPSASFFSLYYYPVYLPPCARHTYTHTHAYAQLYWYMPYSPHSTGR